MGDGRGRKESVSLLCPINLQLPLDGGRKDTLVREYTAVEVEDIVRTEVTFDLEKLLREGARRMLEVALEVEVAEYVKEHREERDAHLRTTNPIESTFATVRHRTRQTKGCGSRIATLTMVYKLTTDAEKHWQRLRGSQLITQVIEGVQFIDGEMKKAA
jgi:hypothetical protein